VCVCVCECDCPPSLFSLVSRIPLVRPCCLPHRSLFRVGFVTCSSYLMNIFQPSSDEENDFVTVGLPSWRRPITVATGNYHQCPHCRGGIQVNVLSTGGMQLNPYGSTSSSSRDPPRGVPEFVDKHITTQRSSAHPSRQLATVPGIRPQPYAETPQQSDISCPRPLGLSLPAFPRRVPVSLVGSSGLSDPQPQPEVGFAQTCRDYLEEYESARQENPLNPPGTAVSTDRQTLPGVQHQDELQSVAEQVSLADNFRRDTADSYGREHHRHDPQHRARSPRV